MIKKLIKKYTEYKILKLKTDIDNVMLYRISIMLSEDFSDKKLLEVNELSINLFFHIINNEKLSETLFEIKEKILKDSIFNKFLSTRYLLFSYYSEILEYEKGIEEYFIKAEIIDSSIVKLDKKSFNILEKDIKKTKKELRKEKQLLIEEKIEKKKKEEI